ncbi:MAG: hypothetical protein ABIJ86_03240 [Spirochaetota bacterium]
MLRDYIDDGSWFLSNLNIILIFSLYDNAILLNPTWRHHEDQVSFIGNRIGYRDGSGSGIRRSEEGGRSVRLGPDSKADRDTGVSAGSLALDEKDF